jgi:hypothetical protein
MWRAVKDFLRPHNKQEDYEFHLAHYMFAARFKVMGVPQFNQFLAVVASTDWVKCSNLGNSASGAICASDMRRLTRVCHF